MAALEVLIPRLSRGYRIESHLESIDFDEIRRAFQSQFRPLPLGHPQEREINYEGRHLITNEIVEQMRIKLTLLTDGMGAISFFREELERATKIRGQHAKLAPLIQRFLEELLFGEKVTLYDKRVLARLGDTAVREHIRATFVPIIRKKITSKKERLKEEAPQSVCSWRPFQATASERHQAIIAKKTPFNLVTCNLQLEVTMCDWLDLAGDVAAFAKNAGPQALRIDYLTAEGRRAIYTPDFLIRKTDGAHILMETKGPADKDVPPKARAASEWCRAASTKRARWSYVYVPQAVFERFSGDSVEELAETCAPSLVELLRESESPQFVLDFEKPDQERLADQVMAFVDTDTFEKLPLRDRKAIEHAIPVRASFSAAARPDGRRGGGASLRPTRCRCACRKRQAKGLL